MRSATEQKVALVPRRPREILVVDTVLLAVRLVLAVLVRMRVRTRPVLGFGVVQRRTGDGGGGQGGVVRGGERGSCAVRRVRGTGEQQRPAAPRQHPKHEKESKNYSPPLPHRFKDIILSPVVEAPPWVIAWTSVVALPLNVRWVVVRVERSFRSCGGGASRPGETEHGIVRGRDGGRIVGYVRRLAVECGHVEVCRSVVRQPQPRTDAFGPRARRHHRRDVKVRIALRHALPHDGENDQVVPRHESDVADVRNRECAAG